MKVIDASALYDLLLRNDRGRVVATLIDDDLFAPDLAVTEVLQALRRDLHRKALSARPANQLVDDLRDADIELLPAWPYTDRIWALRGAVSAFDAAYVATAEDLGCALLTVDHRLAGARGTRCPVVTV